MKVSEKGQVTLPQEAREATALRPGDEVEIDATADRIRLHPVETRVERGRRYAAELRGGGDIELTTDEIMAMTRGED